MMLAILADDLTGACDTGCLFAGAGAVPVTVWPLDEAPARANVARVQVVDTESRHLGAGEAAARVTRAAHAHPAPSYFKKIDSTLRGSIGAEVEALMTVTGARRALVCPAFPAQGRTVVDRRLLVEGRPAADVVDRLRPQLTRPIASLRLAEVRAGRAALGAALARLDAPVVVADAETDGDLDALVDAALTLDAAPLLVGAAGLARALAARLGVLRERVALPPARRWLLIAGSLHPATRRQVQAARDAGLTVIASAPAASADAGAAARTLADEARRLLQTERFDAIVVTGGDTAVALYDALGRGRLELVGPPGPGLALARLAVPGRDDIWLVTKAGGFGDPDLLVSLAKAAA
ncbi:MAG: hypothetical protein HY216_13225 [Candidatus Rokubacteria bacterium]|nr:hypothetical protein [Candidatus Rokubacteria bacterium]